MLSATTELEAINIMLAAIGADPVNEIDEDNDVDINNTTNSIDPTKLSAKSSLDFEFVCVRVIIPPVRRTRLFDCAKKWVLKAIQN